MRSISSVFTPRLGGVCLALLALFFAAGCASDETAKSPENGASPAVADKASEDAGGNDAVTRRPRGEGIKVTWQALAHERHLYENPKYGRRPIDSATPDFAIVLVNESHPESDRLRQGRGTSTLKAGSGVLSDQQMKNFIAGLEQIGYFKAASGTGGQARFFDDERARGRVTVERANGSVTLLSLRGQGRSPTTKHIPGIYSQAKQAIAMLKNQTRTLSVETITRGDVPYR